MVDEVVQITSGATLAAHCFEALVQERALVADLAVVRPRSLVNYLLHRLNLAKYRLFGIKRLRDAVKWLDSAKAVRAWLPDVPTLVCVALINSWEVLILVVAASSHLAVDHNAFLNVSRKLGHVLSTALA